MKGNQGFTVIELLIALGIVIVIGLVSFLSLGNRKNTSELDQASRQVVALLREAQSRSMAQASGTNWGVYFANPTTTPGFYSLFPGSIYASSSEIKRYRLPVKVQYSTSSIGSGSSSTISFSEITGFASQSTTVVLTVLNNAVLSSTISITSSGLISF